MRIKRVKMLLFVVIFGGCLEGNKITEQKAMSYAEFSRDVGADDFDPIGAEQIYHRRIAEGDILLYVGKSLD